MEIEKKCRVTGIFVAGLTDSKVTEREVEPPNPHSTYDNYARFFSIDVSPKRRKRKTKQIIFFWFPSF